MPFTPRLTLLSVFLSIAVLLPSPVFVLGVPPQVLSSTFEQKHFTVLGRRWQMTYFEVRTDQPLAISSNVGCPLSPACPQDTISCDYSGEGPGCLPPTVEGCIEKPLTSVCGPQYQYQTLEPNTWSSFDIQQSRYQYFRVYTEKPCNGLVFFLSPSFGNPNIYVSADNPEPTKDNFQWSSSAFGADLLQLCPQYEFFAPGTLFVGIFASAGATQGSLGFRLFETLTASTIPACSPPVHPSFSEYGCLRDGALEVVTGFTDGDVLPYVVDLVSTCPQVLVTIRSTVDLGRANLLIAAEPDYLFEQPLISVSSLRTGSYSFSLCPHNSLFPDNRLLVAVQVINAGVFDVMVSSQVFTFTLPFANLSSLTLFEKQLSSSVMRFADGSQEICLSLLDSSQCDVFWNQKHSNPLSPLPQVFSDWFSVLSQREVFLYDAFISDQEYLPDTVTGFLINEYDVGLGPHMVRTSTLASTGVMTFLGRITNEAGEALVAELSFSEVHDACFLDGFEPLFDNMTATLALLAEMPLSADSSYFYLLLSPDRESFRRDFQECDRLMVSIQQPTTQVSTDSPRPWQECIFPAPGPAFDSDPCCNSSLLIDECCNHRETTVTLDLFPNPEFENVAVACIDPNCSFMFVEDYAFFANAQAAGTCLQDYVILTWQQTAFYFVCKDTILGEDKNGPPCSSDDQCAFLGPGTKCDFRTHSCALSSADLELAFLRCITATMPIEVATMFRQIFNLQSPDFRSPEYLDELRSAVQTRDCTSGEGGIPVTFREHFFVDPTFVPGSLPGECWCTGQVLTGFECLDSLCNLPKECLQSKYQPCAVDFKEVATSPLQCNTRSVCNWLACFDDQSTEHGCRAICLDSLEFFCGICDNPYTCALVPGLSSEQVCEETLVCVLPNGSLLYDLTEEQCSSYGECSVLCPGASCRSSIDRPSLCYDPNPNAACLAENGGYFDSLLRRCTYAAYNNPTACAAAGLEYVACSLLNEQECRRCEAEQCSDPSHATLACYWDSHFRDCETKQDCETNGGECDDVKDFEAVLRAYGTVAFRFQLPVPLELGLCLFPFQRETYPPSLRQGASFYCTPPLVPTMVGCSLFLSTESECSMSRGVFQPRRYTPEECLSAGQACKPTLAWPLIGVPNGHNESNCDSCQGMKYEEIYHWNTGKWHPASSRRPSWQERKMVYPLAVDNTIDFQLIAQTIEESFIFRQRLLMGSQSLCTYSRILGALLSVSCSCGLPPNVIEDEYCNEEYDKAAAHSTSLVGRVLACSGSEQVLKVAPSEVVISGTITSVTNECFLVSGATQLIEQYRIPPFVAQVITPLRRVSHPATPLSYEVVYNRKGALVGTLLGDGVTIDTEQQIWDGRICLALRPSVVVYTKNMSLPTFAASTDGDAIVAFNATPVADSVGRWCIDITVPRGSRTYFPALVYPNWEEIEDPGLSTSEQVISVLTILLFAGFLAYCAILFLPLRGATTVAANYLFLFFCLALGATRMVYFILLLVGVVGDGDEAVLDLLLMDLPTFFYLSAVSVFANSFFFFVLRRGGQREIRESRFWASLGFFNLIIYLAFVLVLLLFILLPDGTHYYCGDRLAEPSDISKNVRIFRLVYMAVVTTIAVILVAIVLLFGWTIWIRTRSRTILHVLLGSLGLLFDCLAIFIYYLINQTSIYMAMVFWFAEVLPLGLLIYLLSPLRHKLWDKAHTRKHGSTVQSRELPPPRTQGNLYRSSSLPMLAEASTGDDSSSA